jgi:hypothetical protein
MTLQSSSTVVAIKSGIQVHGSRASVAVKIRQRISKPTRTKHGSHEESRRTIAGERKMRDAVDIIANAPNAQQISDGISPCQDARDSKYTCSQRSAEHMVQSSSK